MELHEALAHIAEIRARVAASERFHGYRPLPVAASGVLAILVAGVQPNLVPDPAANLLGYLALWLTTAVVAAATAGTVMLLRRREPLARELTRLAVGQFAPCLVAGALVTAALARHAAEFGWALPGLWQVIFALGIFASYRLLPSAIVAVGVYYLLTGTVNLTLGPAALSPWGMGVPFGVGQIATAAILYWNRERDHAD